MTVVKYCHTSFLLRPREEGDCHGFCAITGTACEWPCMSQHTKQITCQAHPPSLGIQSPELAGCCWETGNTHFHDQHPSSPRENLHIACLIILVGKATSSRARGFAGFATADKHVDARRGKKTTEVPYPPIGFNECKGYLNGESCLPVTLSAKISNSWFRYTHKLVQHLQQISCGSNCPRG